MISTIEKWNNLFLNNTSKQSDHVSRITLLQFIDIIDTLVDYHMNNVPAILKKSYSVLQFLREIYHIEYDLIKQ